MNIPHPRQAGRRNLEARLHRPSPGALLALAGTLLVVGFALWFGLGHVPADREREIATWRGRLSAMADDRRFALDAWLTHGLADARVIARFPTVRYLLTGGASASVPFPRDLGASGHLRQLLQGALDEQGYRYAALVSAASGVIEAIGDDVAGRQAGAVAAAERAIREGNATVDAWRHSDGSIGLLFAAPVGAATPAGQSPGAIVLDADPESFPLPLLRLEQALTRTGETLLARREGGDAVFIFPPGRDAAPALALRRSLDAPRLAMRSALDGDESFGLFLDHGGAPVLAATRRLRSVPWGLVVKVDLAEVLAVHERRTRAQAGAGTLLLLTLIGLGVALLRWRSAALDARLNASHARVALLLDQANDAILFFGPDGRVREANRRAEELYGVPGEALAGRHARELQAEDDERPATPGQQAQALASGLRFETVHLHADGSRVPVEVSSRSADLDGERTVVSVVRDIRERKQAEARLQRLNRLYRTLSEVNQLIVRGADRAALYAGVCRILAEEGGFPLAWLGLKRPDGRVEITAGAGVAVAYLDGLDVRWDDTPLGQGPAGKALRGARAVVLPEVQGEPSFAPWRERAAAHGLISVAAIPVVVAGEAIGILLVYGSAPGDLGAEDCELVSELAGDVGFAVERLAVDEERRSLEEKLRAIFLGDLIGILFGDIHGGIKDANDAFLEIVGYSRDELAQGTVRWDAITPPEHLSRDAEAVAEAREHGSCTPYEKEYIRKDGSRVWVLVGFVLLEPERERSVALILDIADRKRAEAALREAEARTRAIVESAVDGIITIDERGVIESFNAAAGRIFGYPPAEVLGRPVSILMPSPERLRHDGYVARYLETGEKRIIGLGREVIGQRRDGSSFPMDLAVAEFQVGPRRGFAGVVRDLTARKRLEEQFQHAQKMEAIGRLAGGVAHDFNNLLGVITGYAELALRQLESGHPAVPRIAQVAKAAERAAGLTRQLLAFSRRQALAPQVLDLGLLIRDLEKMLQRLIGEDVELVVRGGGPELGAVRVDPGQMEQVVMNLAVNARDAMPHGGQLALDLDECEAEELRRAAHWSIASGRYVRLHVADTGEGMDEATQARIFEPFFTTKAPGVGTGLGLATVFGVVKQSGGHVFVDSGPGRGTRFSICLPRDDQAVDDAGAATPPPARGRETILLVEDQEAMRAVAGEVLVDLGYEVLTAADADAALALALTHRGPIHLLLTDVVMPRVSGPQLVPQITALRPAIKVLLMSGYTSDVLGREGATALSVPLIEKPFTQVALADKVRAVLDGTDTAG